MHQTLYKALLGLCTKQYLAIENINEMALQDKTTLNLQKIFGVEAK